MTDVDGNEIGKLFVGGLAQSTNHDNLQQYFNRFGEVDEAIVMMDHRTGRSRGFGYVKFHDAHAVEQVLESKPHILDGKEIDAKQCNVHMRGKSRRSLKVFVGGIPLELDAIAVRKCFEEYGIVTEVNLMMDHTRMRHRGFAFIGFQDESVVKLLIQTHYVNMGGKQVEVKAMEPPNFDKRTDYIQDIRTTGSGSDFQYVFPTIPHLWRSPPQPMTTTGSWNCAAYHAGSWPMSPWTNWIPQASCEYSPYLTPWTYSQLPFYASTPTHTTTSQGPLLQATNWQSQLPNNHAGGMNFNTAPTACIWDGTNPPQTAPQLPPPPLITQNTNWNTTSAAVQSATNFHPSSSASQHPVGEFDDQYEKSSIYPGSSSNVRSGMCHSISGATSNTRMNTTPNGHPFCCNWIYNLKDIKYLEMPNESPSEAQQQPDAPSGDYSRPTSSLAAFNSIQIRR